MQPFSFPTRHPPLRISRPASALSFPASPRPARDQAKLGHRLHSLDLSRQEPTRTPHRVQGRDRDPYREQSEKKAERGQGMGAGGKGGGEG